MGQLILRFTKNNKQEACEDGISATEHLTHIVQKQKLNTSTEDELIGLESSEQLVSREIICCGK